MRRSGLFHLKVYTTKPGGAAMISPQSQGGSNDKLTSWFHCGDNELKPFVYGLDSLGGNARTKMMPLPPSAALTLPFSLISTEMDTEVNI